mgnify:CR=1 FL=1
MLLKSILPMFCQPHHWLVTGLLSSLYRDFFRKAETWQGLPSSGLPESTCGMPSLAEWARRRTVRWQGSWFRNRNSKDNNVDSCFVPWRAACWLRARHYLWFPKAFPAPVLYRACESWKLQSMGKTVHLSPGIRRIGLIVFPANRFDWFRCFRHILLVGDYCDS